MTRILYDLFPLGFLVLFLKNTKLVKPISGWVESPLSTQAGNSLRALFAVVILLHHLGQEVDGFLLFPIFAKVGYLGAAVFFFLSGYGLQKQYMKNPGYARAFLLHRLPPILIPVLGIGFLYWLMDTQLLGQYISLKVIWLQICEGDPLILFSWYIFVLVSFYFAFQLIMPICGKHYWAAPLLACLWYAGLLWVCLSREFHAWWYNTAHVLILGLAFATYEKPLMAFFRRHYLPCLLAFGLGFGVLQVGLTPICNILHLPGLKFPLVLLRTGLFVAVFVLICQKVTIESPVITYLGSISLEVYLLQGLMLTLLRNDRYVLKSDFWECVLMITGTIAAASVLHPLFRKIIGAIRKK